MGTEDEDTDEKSVDVPTVRHTSDGNAYPRGGSLLTGASYEVGYGKPPAGTRFEKGRSGNPKGRPKGTRNFSTDLNDVLSTRLTVTENGAPKSVTTRKALLLRLREKALKGDGRSLDRLLGLAAEQSALEEASEAERRLSSVESDILQRYEESLLAAHAADDAGIIPARDDTETRPGDGLREETPEEDKSH